MNNCGDFSGRSPELAVVVLAHDFHGSVCDAIDSLLDEQTPLELVVSHSGRGGAELRSALARYGPIVRLEHTDALRNAGAARNAGIRATRAPFVAFLASDCTAAPEWARARLRRHRVGAEVVSSAIAPADGAIATIAEYLILHSFRMPHLAHPAGHAGASYARGLFKPYGEFPELACGEDTVFYDRLVRGGVRFEWAPEVATVHRPPRSLPAMLRDQLRRGRDWGPVDHDPRVRVLLAFGELVRPGIALARAVRAGSPLRPWSVALAAPAVFGAGACRAVGLLSATRGASANQEELEAVMRHVWFGRRTTLGRRLRRPQRQHPTEGMPRDSHAPPREEREPRPEGGAEGSPVGHRAVQAPRRDLGLDRRVRSGSATPR